MIGVIKKSDTLVFCNDIDPRSIKLYKPLISVKF